MYLCIEFMVYDVHNCGEIYAEGKNNKRAEVVLAVV